MSNLYPQKYAWEYRSFIREERAGHVEYDYDRDIEQGFYKEESLNKIGSQGWEVIHIDKDGRVLCKRRKLHHIPLVDDE